MPTPTAMPTPQRVPEDPEDPDGTNGDGADTPELLEIEDEDTPLADAETIVELPTESPTESENVELPDEEVLLSSVPRTGDDLPLWCAAALLALAGLAVRKRRQADAKCKH
jgi:hypothetical protein